MANPSCGCRLGRRSPQKGIRPSAALLLAALAAAGLHPAAGHRVVIVVPCYNEEHRLQAAAFLNFLHRPEAANVSLVFVNDGSRDNTLARLTKLRSDAAQSGRAGHVGVLDLQPNGGKAEAVRKGLLAALVGAAPGLHGGPVAQDDGDVVGFWDGDLATPLEAVYDLLGAIRGAEDAPGRPRFPAGSETSPIDMAFGARVGLLGREVNRSLGRHYLGRVFATLASHMLGLPIYDTQCGAKLFRATPQLHEALAAPFEAGWIFDVELLARLTRAYVARGLSLQDAIFEYPLHRWHDLPGSKLGMGAKVGALRGLIAIWWEHLSPWSGPWDPTNGRSEL